MATFTTGKGFFNLSANNTSMIDWDYSNFIDYDDDTRFDLASFMMTKGNSAETGTPEFYTWAGELNPRTTTISATTAVTADDTVIYLANTSGIRVDDVLHLPTAAADGEHMRVTAIGAGSVTVVRINTTAGTAAKSATVVILGSASSETATTSIGSSWMEPTKVTNRCQLIRRSFELTRTEMATDVQTAQTRLQQKTEQARKDFQLDLAHTMWFSISTVDASTSYYFTSKGINEQLANYNSASNLVNANGALAVANFTALMEILLPYSTSSKYVCFTGDNALGGLVDLGAGTSYYRTKQGDNKFGFSGQTIVAGDFEFLLKFERLFSIIGAPYNGYLFALDMNALRLRHLKNGKFEFKANIHSDPGGEVVKSQFRAQVGVEMTHEKRHGLIYGIT